MFAVSEVSLQNPLQHPLRDLVPSETFDTQETVVKGTI